jgi:hypothetical protein
MVRNTNWPVDYLILSTMFVSLLHSASYVAPLLSFTSI